MIMKIHHTDSTLRTFFGEMRLTLAEALGILVAALSRRR